MVMKIIKEFTSMKKRQFVLIIIVAFLYVLVINFLMPLTNSYKDAIKEFPFFYYFILITSILIPIIAFCSFMKYQLFEDRVEIRYFLGVKLPIVIVSGRRINSFIAFPFSLSFNPIYYTDITEVSYESSWQKAFHITNLCIKKKNGQQFRLPFFTMHTNDAVSMRDLIKKRLN